MKTKRKTILYIAASLDGYIAKSGDDLSFLSIGQQEGEDYGYADFMKTVDTVIMGRKTYDWVMTQVSEFPHSDLETFIITRTARPSIGKIHFWTGGLKELIDTQIPSDGKNIFIDGGAEVVNALLEDALIDEMILFVFPVLLGEGVRLFRDGRPEQVMKLVGSRQYASGVVQLHYNIDNLSDDLEKAMESGI